MHALPRLALSALFAALAASGCTPMIENGRDHRHDPHFQKGDAEDGR